MNYEFPQAITIDEVRAAIVAKPEFIEAEREGYRVFNYNVNFVDTFPPVEDRKTAILRELRGLIFYSNGELASRRYQKFFNMNERAETLVENIDWTKPHWIMEKLDGSMVTPFIAEYASTTKWFSKMGDTFVSEQIAEWFLENETRMKRYEDFAWTCYLQGMTPIFEWCTPKNRIVVAYPEARLVLTAIRYNYIGDYLPLEEMEKWAKRREIDCVKFFEGGEKETFEYIKNLETNTEDEGFVIRFVDGHMVKVKTAWYIQLHKVKSYLDQEKDVAKLILENNIDDLIAVLDEADINRINLYSSDLQDSIWLTIDALKKYTEHVVSLNLSKKDYAIDHASKINGFFRNVVFRYFDRLAELTEAEIEAMIVEYLLTKMSTNAKFSEAKKELGINLTW